MYSYKFTKQVEKFLSRQDKAFLIDFMKKISILIENPLDNNLDIKPLKGLPYNYRLRIGKYRILYHVINSEFIIYFYKAGSRGNVYK